MMIQAILLALHMSVIASDASSAPAPAPAASAPAAVQDGGDHELRILVGRSHMITSEHRVEQVIVVDPTVADAEVVSPRRLLLFGRKLGMTDVILQLENGTSARYSVEISLDHDSLQERLDSLFGPGLELDAEDGVLVLSGYLDTVSEAVLLEKFMAASGHDYVDMTRVPGVQQVLLKVRIAEVSRRAIRQLGFSAVVGGGSAFGGFQPGADAGGSFNPVGISPVANGAISPSNYVYQEGANSVASAATLFGGVPAADLALYINALKQNNYVRVLAEPNLVAISGEEATFLVGGEFPVPVVQGTSVGVGSSVTVEYKEVGVRLRFRPEVLGENRIRLQVAPEVSELSETFGTEINGQKIKGVRTRRSSTTVELRSGQTFAMAGLLNSKTEAQNASIPLLGDLPFLGALFRSVRYTEDQTELVVLVTAELVEPLDSIGSEPVPGFMHQRPNDWQFFVDGRIEDTIVAPLPPSQAKAMRELGLDKLTGPGAWKRFDDSPEPARPDVSIPALDERSVPEASESERPEAGSVGESEVSESTH